MDLLIIAAVAVGSAWLASRRHNHLAVRARQFAIRARFAAAAAAASGTFLTVSVWAAGGLASPHTLLLALVVVLLVLSGGFLLAAGRADRKHLADLATNSTTSTKTPAREEANV